MVKKQNIYDYQIADKIGLDTETLDRTRYRQGYDRTEIVNGENKMYSRSSSKVRDLNYLQNLLKNKGKCKKNG